MSALWITLTLVIVFGGLGIWTYRRFSRQPSGLDDRYAPGRLLTPEQAQMLDYLRQTFPGQVVLPNLMLGDMLSVRRAADPRRAKERLRNQKVDFVVCDEEGRPSFAFDVEQYHLSDAKAKTHLVKIKNRILKTAGVRFVFLKSSIRHMPSPADFRSQLNLAALTPPISREDERESMRQQLESQLSEFDQLYPATEFRESEIMGLSGLMGLQREDGGRGASRNTDNRSG
ncbi:MAG: DUF2726 domain-containing protein [Polaromonas sp.]